MTHYLDHPTAVRLSFCKRGTGDDSFSLVDGYFHCERLGIERSEFDDSMEPPELVDGKKERRVSLDTLGGSGVGSGTTVVATGGGATTVVTTSSQQQAAPQSPGIVANNMVSNEGIDGVVSNPFAKEKTVKVDVKMTERKDLCLETYGCCFIATGGFAWFFKIPDCLGCGCEVTSLFGGCARSFKFLQKPTFCELAAGCVFLDMSTCCAKKKENDKECCVCWQCSQQCVYCCLFQDACELTYGLMRTLLSFWEWVFCVDYRCACPPSNAVPLQCLCCGFGYRAYNNEGVGFRMQADNTRDDGNNAPQTNTNTTVVVVNQAQVAPVAPA